MKKLACAAAISFMAITPAMAEELSVSTIIGFESRYIFRGVQFAETSFQPGINIAYGNFYGGAWLNLPVGDDDLVVTPGGEELDLFVGYTGVFDDAFTYDVGVTYYTFPDLMSGFFDVFREDQPGQPGANTVEVFAGLSFNGPLSPSIYGYYDFYLDSFTVEGGAEHSIPIAEGWSFDIAGSVGYVVDDDAGGDYLYGNVSGDIAYAISDDSSITAGVRYGGSDIPGGAFIDDSIAATTMSGGFWWGVGFSSEF